MLYPFSLTLDLYIQAESFEEAKKLAEAYVQDASLGVSFKTYTDMKIIKIPITEQNREVYWSRNKDKKAWEKLMSECPSMTSKEFWNNEWEEFDKEEISTHWYFIVGKPESIIDELINLEIGDTNVFYPHIKENRPWDIEEMDWYDLREHANTMSDFIQKLYNYI